MRSLPPLTALRAFEAAARHGNFAKAAAELGVTAGAVSQHIKGLEERLGIALFRRLARGVRLTEAGRAYLPGIAEGFDRLARATLQVHDSGLAGRLTITVLPSFAAGWLVRRLPGFRTRDPMSTPAIITVAITGSQPTKAQNPAVPIHPAEQVESTHEAYEAGASLVREGHRID